MYVKQLREGLEPGKPYVLTIIKIMNPGNSIQIQTYLIWQFFSTML